jgi:hypothetical protein
MGEGNIRVLCAAFFFGGQVLATKNFCETNATMSLDFEEWLFFSFFFFSKRQY